MWQCVAELADTHHYLEEVCCSVLQCVAMCCNVLQCVEVCCSWSLNLLIHSTTWKRCVAVCCSVWQCVAMFFSVSQWVAMCCRALADTQHHLEEVPCSVFCSVLQCVAVRYSVLQCVATGV